MIGFSQLLMRRDYRLLAAIKCDQRDEMFDRDDDDDDDEDDEYEFDGDADDDDDDSADSLCMRHGLSAPAVSRVRLGTS